jgi:hypothetical protein
MPIIVWLRRPIDSGEAGILEDGSMKEGERRPKARAERVDTKCGSIGHMTVDEIKERVIGEDLNVACPECGEIHLTAEDVEEAEKKRITETQRYKKIRKEAEAES